ncbi:hypothetical protein [Candidatus Amarolinea dominans]|uniref:hypothetical protein n=1 Tax=Candidatus Amarolinea dominans TaxID=3140696 RepID=UPI0031366DD2|nr:hypothetical protein [Anaerolineae bacterium]
MAPGIHLGNCRSAGGGYAPRLAGHESQLMPIPDAVSPEQAVFADPFAVSLHAVLRGAAAPGAAVLVCGCGTLGLLAITILRPFPTAQIIAVARYAHQEKMRAAGRTAGDPHAGLTRSSRPWPASPARPFCARAGPAVAAPGRGHHLRHGWFGRNRWGGRGGTNPRAHRHQQGGSARRA